MRDELHRPDVARRRSCGRQGHAPGCVGSHADTIRVDLAAGPRSATPWGGDVQSVRALPVCAAANVGPGQRADLRDERLDQQDNASVESTKKLGQELGADYMLIGNISSIVDEAPNRKDLTVFYVMNLELVDIQSNVKVWIGDDKIKKLIERKNYKGR